jgi:hypothetical protein
VQPQLRLVTDDSAVGAVSRRRVVARGHREVVRRVGGGLRHGVAAQVAFESKGLKPDSHLIGSRFETRRFQAMGQWIQFVQPHRGV